MMKVKSLLDVGCGLGIWLAVGEELGVKDYLGIDGPYVDTDKLAIKQTSFLPRDLRKVFDLERKFDLVISLEVAEHLPESVADMFVEGLIRHGDTILFSAAIPNQNGIDHINEQWPEYWEKKFKDHGYYFHDVIRPMIWNDERVEWWYRQNTFLVSRQAPTTLPFRHLSIVHPKLFESSFQNYSINMESVISGRQGIFLACKIFYNAISFKIRKLLGR